MILTRRRVARAVRTDIVWGDFLERDAIGHQKFVRGGAMIGEPPHDGSVIIAVIRPAVGLDDGPVGQIAKDEVWGIRNAVFALRARAAASILTELIQGRTLQEVITLPQEALLTALHTTIRPARVKCALLPLHILQAGLAIYLHSYS